MKKLLTGAIAAFALAVAPMESLAFDPIFSQITFTPASADYSYGLRGQVEYNGNFDIYPNFWVSLPNQNKLEDGSQDIYKGWLDVTITDPEGNKHEQKNVYTAPGVGAAESHAWYHGGANYKAGNYTMTVNMRLFRTNDANEQTTEGAIVETFTGTFTLPEVVLVPWLDLNGVLVTNEDTKARINYTCTLRDFAGEASTVKYKVELFDNPDCTGTPVQTKETAADGFDMTGMTPGAKYNYAVRATVTGDGLNLEPVVRTFSWRQGGIPPTSATADLQYELIPTYSGSTFKYNIVLTGATEDEVESVLVAVMKGGQPFSEEAPYHATTLSGSIDVDFPGETEGVWIKALVTLKTGAEIQASHWDQNITLTRKPMPTLESLKIVCGEFTRTSATSGTIPYTIQQTGDASCVDYYEVWASRVGDENMNVTRVAANALEGTLTLDVLPSAAQTPIWVKVKAYYINGTNLQGEQCATQADTRPKVNLSLTITDAFYCITHTSGTLPYTITATGDVEDVDHYVVWASREGNEEMAKHETTALSGNLNLTDLPESAVTNVYVKMKAVYKGGSESETIQVGPVVCDTGSIKDGVDEIEAAEGKVRWFDFYGIEISNPVKGHPYIRVQGSKTEKVVF